MPYETMSCSRFMSHSFMIEPSGPGLLPREIEVMMRSRGPRQCEGEEENRRALVLGHIRVGPREQQSVLAELRAGSPDLRAVDEPGLAARLGARAQRGEVRPAHRLGEELAPDLLAAQRW